MTTRKEETWTAIFKSGKEITRSTKDFETRNDFYTWICINRLGKIYGSLQEIKTLHTFGDKLGAY